MATLSGTLKRFRVFLDMGKPPLEIVAYSSALFFPFRLKQNKRQRGLTFQSLFLWMTVVDSASPRARFCGADVSILVLVDDGRRPVTVTDPLVRVT